MKYRSFIGLEIHIHLLTKTKAFCACKAHYGDEPNSNVCPVCLGYPGALPALNGEAVLMGYTVAKALGCSLSPRTVFERKNYFYPDMPKNYQISQFAAPLGTGGAFVFETGGTKRKLGIKECHLEEDAGKMIHAGSVSLIDFNRAGTSLLEIVTEPDLETGEEAESFLQEFRRLVRHVGVCDGNMEEGSLRCDANVSVNEEGRGLGTKVEIKNMNSFRFVRKAMGYEILRQTKALSEGMEIFQETRLWNENRDITETMRKKESSHDYRFFPEPDLPPFLPDAEFLAKVEAAQVETPLARRDRLLSRYGISNEQADFLVEEKSIADYFEKASALGADSATAAAWIVGDVRAQLNKRGLRIEDCPMTPSRLAETAFLLASQRINSRIAKQLIQSVFEEDKDPGLIVKERAWMKITDKNAVGAFVDEVILKEKSTFEGIRAGNGKALAFLVGETIKLSGGRADPGIIKEILSDRMAT